MDKGYVEFISDLKKNIVQSRYVAARLINREQLLLYFKIGKMLAEKIDAADWGAGIMDRIATDLQNALPGIKGFSSTGMKNMRRFYEAYADFAIGQTVSDQLQTGILKDEAFFGISFSHHIALINKCETTNERVFYMTQAASQYWSLRVMEHHIAANLYKHRGKLANNFDKVLPDNLKTSALEVLQDEYLFDFVATDEEDERVFEGALVSNIKNMIMTLGKGFSFLGNQYRLEVGGEEFFVDLLFFNRHLRSLVAFELKRGKFKPEYAGQLNFYLNVLDEKVRLPEENASIGIVLCKEKNNTVVEFAVKTIDKAMGVATYRTTKVVPKEMKGILPDAVEFARLL
jgi:predicted nuclease of restriction endonuclease-like (RecB) superfamily